MQHKNVPPQIESIYLQTNNSLKQVQYLMKHEEVLPTQKKIHTKFSLITVKINSHFKSKEKVTLLFGLHSILFHFILFRRF